MNMNLAKNNMFENLLIAITLLLVLGLLLPNIGRLYSATEEGAVLIGRIAKRIRLFVSLLSRSYRRSVEYPYYS